MKIYSADTWSIEELQEMVADAGRRSLVVPPADHKKAVLEVFGEDLDALNDSLHDFADSITENGHASVTVLWQVAAPFRRDRSFGIICEILQDAESYAGDQLAVTAVML
jgi:hypothetical protein